MFERVQQRCFDWFGRRYAPVVIAAVAALLGASSLAGDRTLDDWVVTLVARGEGAAHGFSSKPWDSFRFTSGDPARNQQLIERGVLLPWWTAPELALAFWRPLAGFSHVLDELCWPSRPVLLHVHSLLWFSALLVAVWAVYRRLAGNPQLAGLAFALYAFDDAHGATLSWLANRNALISASFGCACLWAHDVARRERTRRYAQLSLLCFALSCAASELSVGALGYLVAYASFLDRAPLRQRLQSLGGHAVICVAWRAYWSLAGYGARGSGAYVDPLADPLGFLAGAPRKWLCLLQGQLGIIPADFGFLGSASDQRLWMLTGLLTLAGAAVLLRPCVVDATGKFWLTGMLLSLLPMAASFPSDRLLLLVGLGVAPLLARAFQRACSGTTRGFFRAGIAAAFLGVHGLLAPLLLPVRAGQMGRMARAEGEALSGLRASVPSADQTLIVLNAPSLLLANYAQLRSSALGLPQFARLYVLSATDSPVSVTRSGADELTLHAALGFLHTPLEQHYRGAVDSLPTGSRVELAGLSAEVTQSLADGRPESVRFTLRGPLSDYAFSCWTDGGFGPCALPALGRSLRLEPEDLGHILYRPRRD